MGTKVTWTPHGIKMAIVTDHARTPPERTEIKGWTSHAARRNRDFLQSIDPARLNGLPVSYTLTVKDCPPDAVEWARSVENLRRRLQRMGSVRDHWVIEWQKRGVPHLHGLAYFDRETVKAADGWAKRMATPTDPGELAEMDQFLSIGLCNRIKEAWLQIAAPYRAGPLGQHVAPLWGISGWLGYLSKHSSRGVDHYQRQRNALPDGWKSSGRLWGKGGDWPTLEIGMVLDERSGFRLRRALRAYGMSNAREQLRRGLLHGNAAQIAAAKRSIRYLRRVGHSKAESVTEKRRWSALRGVNVFVGGDMGRDLVEWAIDHDTSSVTDARTITDGHQPED